ncbi:MAG: FHA domain-containing protein [Polyangiaceae bacterium]|nr:FHA domain-containing protein [Polyangiaceae bacterium]
MPITIIIRTVAESGGTDEPPSLTFDGTRIVIGRGSGSDVRLPDPTVSTRHATIRALDTEYAVVDEDSTNGTLVGGVKLVPQTPRIVKSGDMVRIGRVWLEVMIGQKAATADLGLATRDLALALVRAAMNALGDDTVTKLRIVEGADLGGVLRLTDSEHCYLIGRAERCDLPLADQDCSREHASVTRRGGQVFLRDNDSHNGVVLGESRIPRGRDVPWRSPMMARIGCTVLALDEPVTRALAELEAAADEPLAEEDAPAPPPPSRICGASRASEAPVMPVAQIDPRTNIAPRRRPRRWSITEILIVVFASAVIAVSVAALAWVLK